ncbi:hypothetical protein CJU89_0504 [Yarrowia sp. B02]|nr:hypothetical protein CJU89_0504 [Yarrowia sp. B02]
MSPPIKILTREEARARMPKHVDECPLKKLVQYESKTANGVQLLIPFTRYFRACQVNGRQQLYEVTTKAQNVPLKNVEDIDPLSDFRAAMHMAESKEYDKPV